MHPAQLATLLKFDREQTTMFKRLYMPYAVEKKPGLRKLQASVQERLTKLGWSLGHWFVASR